MTDDERNLDLLSIFHYVVGALTALFACVPFIHLIIGIALLSGRLDGNNAPPKFFGWLFVIFPSLFILGGWTLAGLMIATCMKLK